MIEGEGLKNKVWEEEEPVGPGPGAASASPSIAQLVMGNEFAAISDASKRNADERRQVNLLAVFDRT